MKYEEPIYVCRLRKAVSLKAGLGESAYIWLAQDTCDEIARLWPECYLRVLEEVTKGIKHADPHLATRGIVQFSWRNEDGQEMAARLIVGMTSNASLPIPNSHIARILF